MIVDIGCICRDFEDVPRRRVTLRESDIVGLNCCQSRCNVDALNEVWVKSKKKQVRKGIVLLFHPNHSLFLNTSFEPNDIHFI